MKNIELIEFTRMVRIKDKTIQLTPTEYKLLNLFTKQPGIALSRSSIIQKLKHEGIESSIKERTIDYHITRLRRKLGATGKKIISVYGVGYRFENLQTSDAPYRFAQK
jgi:DNA-binding response OmpR family regulator